jgi:hypothetical protein
MYWMRTLKILAEYVRVALSKRLYAQINKILADSITAKRANAKCALLNSLLQINSRQYQD